MVKVLLGGCTKRTRYLLDRGCRAWWCEEEGIKRSAVRKVGILLLPCKAAIYVYVDETSSHQWPWISGFAAGSTVFGR